MIQHTLRQSEKYFKKDYDIIIDLDATSPLRDVKDIINSYRYFKKKGADILMSGCPSRRNPYFNMVEIANKKLKKVKPLKKDIFRRQDAPKTYDCNASIYIWKKKIITQFQNFLHVKNCIVCYARGKILGYR